MHLNLGVISSNRSVNLYSLLSSLLWTRVQTVSPRKGSETWTIVWFRNNWHGFYIKTDRERERVWKEIWGEGGRCGCSSRYCKPLIREPVGQVLGTKGLFMVYLWTYLKMACIWLVTLTYACCSCLILLPHSYEQFARCAGPNSFFNSPPPHPSP